MSFHTKSFAYRLAFLTSNKNFHLSSLFMVFADLLDFNTNHICISYASF